MSLAPPRPTIGPPLNGTTLSAVPWMFRTDTGCEGLHGNAEPERPRDRSDGGEDVCTRTRQPVGHECARRHSGGEHPAGVDAEVLREPIGQRDEEAHIVDTLTVGHRSATPVGPAEVDAVGIDHDEPVLISDGVVVRHRRLSATGHPGAVQVDHQAGGLRESGWGVYEVIALQSPERQAVGKVPSGNRRSARTAERDGNPEQLPPAPSCARSPANSAPPVAT